MPPKGRMDFITDVPCMEADMLVCTYTKIDPSNLIAADNVGHLEEICRDFVNRMAGELHKVKLKYFVSKSRKHPLRRAAAAEFPGRHG